MSKPVRVVLVALAVLGVVEGARRQGLVGGGKPIAIGATASLPLTCRLRGHGWKMPSNSTQTPTRRTCQKCQRIDVPMP